MSPCLGDLKLISFSEMIDCACKKYNEMCDFLSPGGVFLNRRGNFKVISACGTTLLLDLEKSPSNDQSDCSILSCDHKFILIAHDKNDTF